MAITTIGLDLPNAIGREAVTRERGTVSGASFMPAQVSGRLGWRGAALLFYCGRLMH